MLLPSAEARAGPTLRATVPSFFVLGMQDESIHPKLTFRCRPPAKLPSLMLAGSHLACYALLATVHTQDSFLASCRQFFSLFAPAFLCKEDHFVASGVPNISMLLFCVYKATCGGHLCYMWRRLEAREDPLAPKIGMHKGHNALQSLRVATVGTLYILNWGSSQLLLQVEVKFCR
jgi:hypothetical protein